ncbi:hypothetical protein N7468_009189 [Penicillium chermesinum]|uniref:ATP-dependent Clp protease proteolytic subunit n=1 Tax=Penicillium chermesinum TaxID=63820 RepID=A0A9W9NHB3_9EURO|nr:uncharacterized protein N7468_009189 [Penicillium chermesinum]KAJ5219985.1 hypothetical protein N7468_009189 [Penicillium chermesinum]
MRATIARSLRLGQTVPSATASALGRSGFPRAFSSFSPALNYSPPRGWTPTPFVTETVGGGWHTCIPSNTYVASTKTDEEQERIICLNGEVNETMSASIVAQLLFLEADNPKKPISLYINSPGGSVTAGNNLSPTLTHRNNLTFSGLAIYDTMTYISAPVSTICVGQAASMGSLLAGGTASKRFCLPHSSIMVHQPSGGYFGQATDIAIHAKEILRVRAQLNNIYLRHLNGPKKMTLEDIEKLMERDYFMSAEEAKEIGIIDEILDHRVKQEAEKSE